MLPPAPSVDFVYECSLSLNAPLLCCNGWNVPPWVGGAMVLSPLRWFEIWTMAVGGWRLVVNSTIVPVLTNLSLSSYGIENLIPSCWLLQYTSAPVRRKAANSFTIASAISLSWDSLQVRGQSKKSFAIACSASYLEISTFPNCQWRVLF